MAPSNKQFEELTKIAIGNTIGSMTTRPLWGYVLIRPAKPERKTSSGIVLPDSTPQEGHTLQGTVIAVGSGSLAMDGSPIEMEIHVGESVLFKIYEAEKMTFDNDSMYLVDQRQIIAVVYE